MLKEKKIFLFKGKEDGYTRIKDIVKENRITFSEKNQNKSKWKLTQLFNKKTGKKLDNIFYPIYLVPYVVYFSQNIFYNETLVKNFKSVTVNSDFKMIILCLLISCLVFSLSCLCVKAQNYLIEKFFNKLKLFNKKEKIIDELFNYHPISLELLKEISEKIGEEKTSEILSFYDGVILNRDINDILNNDIAEVDNIEDKFKQISSCFFVKEENEETVNIVHEKKETIDEMIERLEKDMAKRGVDAEEILREQRYILLNKLSKEERLKEMEKDRKEEEKNRKRIDILEDRIKANIISEIQNLKNNKNLNDYDKCLLKNILSLESRGYNYISHSFRKEIDNLPDLSEEQLSIIISRTDNGEKINKVLRDYQI